MDIIKEEEIIINALFNCSDHGIRRNTDLIEIYDYQTYQMKISPNNTLQICRNFLTGLSLQQNINNINMANGLLNLNDIELSNIFGKLVLNKGENSTILTNLINKLRL